MRNIAMVLTTKLQRGSMSRTRKNWTIINRPWTKRIDSTVLHGSSTRYSYIYMIVAAKTMRLILPFVLQREKRRIDDDDLGGENDKESKFILCWQYECVCNKFFNICTSDYHWLAVLHKWSKCWFVILYNLCQESLLTKYPLCFRALKKNLKRREVICWMQNSYITNGWIRASESLDRARKHVWTKHWMVDNTRWCEGTDGSS